LVGGDNQAPPSGGKLINAVAESGRSEVYG
jgi:hypothetical protein